MDAADSIGLDDVRTIEELVADRPGVLTLSTIRYQLRGRNQNGLASATVKVGKRLLISRKRYELWLASRAGAA